jgi:hypothetical protein
MRLIGLTGRLGLALAVICAIASTAAAQFPVSGRTALENARGSAIRNPEARTPGNLVQEGVARAREFGRGADIGVDVTETSRPPSLRAQILAESIEIVFDQLNTAITLFHNLILARGGRSPRLSSPIPSRSGTAASDSGSDDESSGLSLLDLNDLLDQFGLSLPEDVDE